MNMLLARGVGCCALLAAWCFVAPDGRAAEPSYRDVLRRYVAHRNLTQGAERPPGYPADAHQVVAIEYAVLLRKDGLDQPVDPAKHFFHPGDQIRVRLQPLSDLYFYVFYEDGEGRRRCLLPSDKNSPRLAKHDQPVELPTDGSVFEFEAAAKVERLLVVAIEKPDDELSTLCDAVCKKPDGRLTPQERASQIDLKARNQKTLTSIRDRQAMAVVYRGPFSEQAFARTSMEMKQRGAEEALLEEPPHDGQTATLLMLISKSGSPPRLAATIPLKSAPAAQNK